MNYCHLQKNVGHHIAHCNKCDGIKNKLALSPKQCTTVHVQCIPCIRIKKLAKQTQTFI